MYLNQVYVQGRLANKPQIHEYVKMRYGAPVDKMIVFTLCYQHRANTKGRLWITCWATKRVLEIIYERGYHKGDMVLVRGSMTERRRPKPELQVVEMYLMAGSRNAPKDRHPPPEWDGEEVQAPF